MQKIIVVASLLLLSTIANAGGIRLQLTSYGMLDFVNRPEENTLLGMAFGSVMIDGAEKTVYLTPKVKIPKRVKDTEKLQGEVYCYSSDLDKTAAGEPIKTCLVMKVVKAPKAQESF